MSDVTNVTLDFPSGEWWCESCDEYGEARNTNGDIVCIAGHIVASFRASKTGSSAAPSPAGGAAVAWLRVLNNGTVVDSTTRLETAKAWERAGCPLVPLYAVPPASPAPEGEPK